MKTWILRRVHEVTDLINDMAEESVWPPAWFTAMVGGLVMIIGLLILKP